MSAPILSDADFISLFEQLGPVKLAKKLGVSRSGIQQRRANLEKKYRARISSASELPQHVAFRPADYPSRICLNIPNGIVLVGSDAHYWPGTIPIMHKAFVLACKEFAPKAVIINGDALDFPSISRHPSIGWESRPQVADEIEHAKERHHEIELAVKRSTPLIWPLGNHDQRFETRLAMNNPEYARIHGVHLKDHFPAWEPCWRVDINDGIIVKHRFKGGIHATHNNTIWAGKTVITGHLHSAKVTPFTDANGTRWGVDAGCLADVNHQAFVNYTEDNVLNWRSAFCVLTFKDGRLLQPELVLKFDSTRIEFRGQIIKP